MAFIPTDDGGFYVDRYEFPNREGERPQHETTLQMARDACAGEGKRLCTDGEWRRACAGPDGDRRFGYGRRYKEGNCFVGTQPSSGHSGMPNEADVVAESGAFGRCQTADGVHDMVGNVEEWVSSSWQGGEGTLEGGASFTASWYATCDGRYSREPHYRLDPREPVYSAGFRCCTSEASPTEADVPVAERAKDTEARMAAARAGASTADYEPTDEVEAAPGLFVDRYEYPNRAGVGPLVAVSWTEAVRRCEAADKHLCTVDEWERACGGEEGRRFPYGDEFDPDSCAIQVEDPLPSATFTRCVTPEGVADLVGGTWEWTGSELARPEGMFAGKDSLREVRGGSWFADAMDGACRPHLGYTAAPQDAEYPDVGFRCCRGSLGTSRSSSTAARVACPDGMAAVGEGCVDLYEYPNHAGEQPARQLDLAEATQACASAGKHLCTLAEWELACGGAERRRWPYGGTHDPDACNLLKGEAGMTDRLASSGAHPACQTPEGVFDLSGNVWEWTTEPRGGGVLMGGGWVATAGFASCATRADAHSTYRTPQTGARCCATAEEATRLMDASPAERAPRSPPVPPGADSDHRRSGR